MTRVFLPFFSKCNCPTPGTFWTLLEVLMPFWLAIMGIFQTLPFYLLVFLFSPNLHFWPPAGFPDMSPMNWPSLWKRVGVLFITFLTIPIPSLLPFLNSLFLPFLPCVSLFSCHILIYRKLFFLSISTFFSVKHIPLADSFFLPLTPPVFPPFQVPLYPPPPLSSSFELSPPMRCERSPPQSLRTLSLNFRNSNALWTAPFEPLVFFPILQSRCLLGDSLTSV